MRSIYTVFILLLILMTTVQCQQTAEDWYNKGNDLYDLGKYNEAVQSFEKAIVL
jgi:outer membrane protein assembly factor BamD (BamD/ComL family)